MNQGLQILAKWMLQNGCLLRRLAPGRVACAHHSRTAQGHPLRSTATVGSVICNVRPTNKFHYSNM